ncbi:DNA primase [Mycoplasma todarodis]|uniref:DNA primase n=1 Tax=Mycoplasma todarodis TaxID=1937191 RepID=A0A4R0XPN6_9MOLU|nr:DNA primase [Mycoplasma todarodis]TCG10845.1 DNA primase [Mycoplasma todarodis]
MQRINVFEQIKESTDIVSEVSVYVDLVKKGKNYWGVCPFHDDTSPSMSVSQEKQMFKCFVCNVGGNVINFIAEFEKITYVNATKKLADKVGIPFNLKDSKHKEYNEKDQKILEVLKEAMNFFQYSLSTTEEGTQALEYLKGRGLTQQYLDKFSIGYAPKEGLVKFLRTKGYDDSVLINASLATENMHDFFRERIVFGIKNNYGQIVGFSARTLDPNIKAKYINSSDVSVFNKSNILYNYSAAEQMIRRNKEIIITEGFMDVIALDKANIYHAVAIMGTALTEEHTKVLKNTTVALMLDSDRAGIAATIKSIKVLLKYNQDIFVVKNTSGLDPDEYFNKHGAIDLQKLTQNREHALEFIFRMHEEKYGNDSPEKVDAFVKSFTSYLKNVNDTYRDFYIQKLVNNLGVSKETVMSKVGILKTQQPKQEVLKPYVPQPPRTEEFVIVDIPSQQVTNDKQIDENKWSLQLLSAMMRKPILINLAMKREINFSDPMLVLISKYLIDAKNGNVKKVSPDMLNNMYGIKGYIKNDSDLPNETEFSDMINRINKAARPKALKKLQNKFNDDKLDDKEKIKLLESMIKLQKEREK